VAFVAIGMTARVLGGLAALTLAVAGLSVAAASAADPPPMPGCAGTFATDPPGDQTDATGESGPQNLDALAGRFPTGADATVTGNLRIANLDQRLPQGSVAVAWYLYWRDGAGAVKYAGGSSDGKTVTWTFGTLATNRYNQEGETTGTLFEGKDGVVQVVLPAAIAKAGQTLSAPYGDTRITTGAAVGPRVLSRSDAVPDNTTMGGKAYTVGACQDSQQAGPTPTPSPATPPADVAPTATPAPSPAATPQPAQPSPTPAQPSPTPAPAPGSGSPAAAPPSKRAGLRVATSRARAGRSIKVRVRSTGRISRVQAVLRRGKRTVGRGRLSRIDGSATLRLRAGKRLRRGRYVLQLTGRDASGAKVSTRRTLTLR